MNPLVGPGKMHPWPDSVFGKHGLPAMLVKRIRHRAPACSSRGRS